jgi:hypothetical protein
MKSKEEIRKPSPAKWIPIKRLKPNPDNPRKISKANLEKAKKSVTDDDWMMGIRPIIVDENYIILGGNQRYTALIDLEETHAWVQMEKGLTDEQKKRFIIKDNVEYGTWDFDSPIFQEGEKDEFESLGVKLPKVLEDKIDGTHKFSEHLNEENNYVVLFFNDRIDWLQALTHFDLESVYAQRMNGKEWSKGIGRLVNGSEYLKKLKDGD